MEDDSMEIDDTVSSNQIIVHESDRIQTIDNQSDQTKQQQQEMEQNNDKQPKKQQQNDEIVVLDDDDDDKYTSNNNKEQPMEIIDLIQKPPMNKCINYQCKTNNNDNDSDKNMLIAPNFCLSYYRIKNVKAGRKEICDECYNRALEHFDKSVTLLKDNQSLINMDIPIRNETFEIVDSDDDNDEKSDKTNDNNIINNNKNIDYLSQENIDFFINNFDSVFERTLNKIDLNKQVNIEIDNIDKRQKKLNNNLVDIQKDLKDVRNLLDTIQNNIYNEFRYERVELPEIHIIDDPFVVLDETQQARKRPLIKRTYPGCTNKTPIKDNKNEANEENRPNDCPIVGTLEKEPLIVDEIYYIRRELHIAGSWIKARFKTTILETVTTPVPTILNDNTINNNNKEPQIDVVNYKMLELKQHKERIVNGKNLAMSKPSKIRFEIGTRIIAPFKEITPTGEYRKTRHDCYYPGIVAEPPVAQNNYRYLIFFDIGYSQYVHYKSVYLVYECSDNVWEDMHMTSRQFIKKYLDNINDRPMVKLSKGQTIRVEYNSKWIMCTVMNVDCSLALIFFDSLNRVEWIYRGSPRLSPMFKEEQNAIKRHIGGRMSLLTKINAPDESITIVQYTKNSDFEKPKLHEQNQIQKEEKLQDRQLSKQISLELPQQQQQQQQQRAVARKSTARPERLPPTTTPITTVPFLPTTNNTNTLNQNPPNISNISEPTSKIMYFTPRDQVITTRLYQRHKCSPACKDYIRHNLNKLRGHNPLSKPLLSGWARITEKVRGRKEILYKSPCGRILRHMAEIHQYLRLTKSDMTVDLFDFSHNVRCLAEFTVECEPDIKDLSKGLEQVAIPVINGINNDVLEFCNYITHRQPMEDVLLNTNPDYLCGCDCDDDCIDKLKCKCWQLTLDGAKYMGKNIDPNSIGYIYRRLPEQVLTGIYECNINCKCSKQTCLNRVVQYPMNVKLQVFKTYNRGWGIRCVNDIPQGTFICIYAGTMHTEQMANKDGVEYGDEYFAELDYIENCEKHKEDYENDAIEPGDDYTNTPANMSNNTIITTTTTTTNTIINNNNDDNSRSRSQSPDDDDDDDDDDDGGDGRRKRKNSDTDVDFVPYNPSIGMNIDENSMRLRRRTSQTNPDNNNDDNDDGNNRKKSIDNVAKQIETVTISDDEDDPKEVLSFNPKTEDNNEEQPKYPSVRSFFGEEEPYVMDTKNVGNIGRFLNHSCSPNIFVQNVFVDTHDVRFPWVAFFSSQFIRAGSELTWNYNYDIGSVPGRVLYCYCGSAECKGRLL